MKAIYLKKSATSILQKQEYSHQTERLKNMRIISGIQNTKNIGIRDLSLMPKYLLRGERNANFI